MHVVAVAVEPEFVKVEEFVGGSATLTFELARIQATELQERNTGSVQLTLMRSDVESVHSALSAILAKYPR